MLFILAGSFQASPAQYCALVLVFLFCLGLSYRLDQRGGWAWAARSSELAGRVRWNYRGMDRLYTRLGIPGVIVEDFERGWKLRVSESTTDEDGRFALPQGARGSVHYLRFSRGVDVLARRRVRIVENALPLMVEVNPYGRVAN